MKNLLAVIIILIFLPGASSAVFHDFGLSQGAKEIAYAIVPQMSYSSSSGYIAYDQSLEENLSLEISYLSYRKPILVPDNSSVQLAAIGKKRIWGNEGLGFYGAAGFGALYSSSLGAIFSPNVGGIIGWQPRSNLKVSVPLIFSIYSDPGVLLDYSAGISFAPMTGRHLIAGAKGVLMAVADPARMAFANTFYYYAGLRADL